jgi:hypothetical protein
MEKYDFIIEGMYILDDNIINNYDLIKIIYLSNGKKQMCYNMKPEFKNKIILEFIEQTSKENFKNVINHFRVIENKRKNNEKINERNEKRHNKNIIRKNNFFINKTKKYFREYVWKEMMEYFWHPSRFDKWNYLIDDNIIDE